MSTAFYLGSWFVSSHPIPVQQDWCQPLGGNLQNLKETSNVEELRTNPEDFDLFPQETQAGIESWVTLTGPTTVGFYLSADPIVGGFYITGVVDLTGFYIIPEGI